MSELHQPAQLTRVLKDSKVVAVVGFHPDAMRAATRSLGATNWDRASRPRLTAISQRATPSLRMQRLSPQNRANQPLHDRPR